MGTEEEYDDETEAYTTGEDDGIDRRERAGRQGRKNWDKTSPELSLDHPIDQSVDTTVPEELTRSFLSDDGTDHRENSTLSRSKSELNQSMESAKSVSDVGTEFAFVGYPSIDNEATNRSRKNRTGHPSLNRHRAVKSNKNSKDHTPAFVKAFLEDMEFKGETMLWHRETSTIDPNTVVLRLKRGWRLPNGTFCAPRLIWTDLRNNQNYGFDIFDIRSLGHASVLHLKDFPYAIPGRSVMLHMKNAPSFIFEAGTEEDVSRFVRGIQWVIARFTQNLVLGNLDGCCELLDLGQMESFDMNARGLTHSEFDWSRAMDDVAEILIESALASTFEI